ncbi:16S rRNA (guanine(527)-N(7))-methyltransferase RsmG [Agilicoccus flavus]|uniref:16S rRNA (guanine(527)-N(7))-methyltransferase RsmG n=1 Tax=Agilicoccus flavus TaxID=2775968 RepID=UPI003559267C
MSDSGSAAVPPDLSAVIEQMFGYEGGVAENYAAILASTGVDHGLVGPREVPRLWERHLLNCAVAAEAVPTGVRVADVGSGAGLPGLVWAIARPDLDMHLVEPLLRRTRWLEATVGELGLTNVTIHRGRAEAFAGELEVEVVTARAVARLEELARWCLPLLVPGGELLALKGASAATELDEARPELERLGAVGAEVREYGVGTLDPPTRVVHVRLGRTPPSPPRGGSPKRRPRRSGPSRRR